MGMIGSKYWRHPDTKLKKCSERTRELCTDHDDCCAVTPCTYCLELEIYGEATAYGTADQSGNHWTGTVGGYAFDAFWERNYLTDVCEFVVELDGEEVYREPCGYISCRDSSAEADVLVGYPAKEGTLRWTKHEPLELPHIDHPDTGCKTWFCGECECSCECVCVTITDPDGVRSQGTICSSGYECEGPIWSGQIGYYDLSLVLGRDIYGECILTATVGGEEQDAVYVTGCKDMSATIVLYDGTTIAVACKICSCEEDTPIDLPTCLCSPVGSILHYAITGSGSGACSLSGEMEYTDRFLNPSWVSGVFTLPTTPTPTEVKLKLSCVTAPGFPVNGFTAEDLTEVNSGFWYEISFISADETTALNTTNPANYRDPDTLNGWVGRCRDGFFAVGYFLNDLCGGIGDGLVSVVITE